MTIATPDSTINAIRLKVRRLIASPSEQQITTDTIDQAINTFYQNDFSYAIKLDQMRSVYTFYTAPNKSKYPLNVNFNQGIRAPIYVDGIQGSFFKDRSEFFRMWPRYPILSNPFVGDGVTQVYAFVCQTIPFLPNNVTLGGVSDSGNAIRVADDGNGKMYVNTPNPVVTLPPVSINVPGMRNENGFNPGDEVLTQIGTVNYVTGQFNLNFALANLIPQNGSIFSLFVSQYQTGRPYSLLFWNNYFEIRPVPKLVHKIEVETYMTPVQFLQNSDSPILNQWWQYLAYGAACEIARERQDMDSLENLMEGFKRQEALVLERQGIEEIGQRNSTIFSGATPQQGWNQGFGFPL